MIEVTDTSDSLQGSSLYPLPFSVIISTLWGKAISSHSAHIHSHTHIQYILEHSGSSEYTESGHR